MTYTAAHHQGAIKQLCLSFWGALMSSKCKLWQRSGKGQLVFELRWCPQTIRPDDIWGSVSRQEGHWSVKKLEGLEGRGEQFSTVQRTADLVLLHKISAALWMKSLVDLNKFIYSLKLRTQLFSDGKRYLMFRSTAVLLIKDVQTALNWICVSCNIQQD